MSGFDLARVDGDGGGAPIHLPPGETVLGRGPLLGVSDKRVSRLHGLLENLDGQLRLKPTHLNPCFVQSTPTDDPRPLQRDAWHRLHHGARFSLLPGQFVFQVAAVGGGDRTPRNSQTLEEEELPDVEPQPPVGQTPTPPAAPSNRRDAANEDDGDDLDDLDAANGNDGDDLDAANGNDGNDGDDLDAANGGSNKGATARPKAVQVDQRDDAPSGTGRVLPAWMMAAVAHAASSSSSSCSPKVQAAGKRSKGPKPAAAKQATPTNTSSPEEAELCGEEMPRKRRRKTRDEEEESAQSKTDVPPERRRARLQSQSKRAEVSAELHVFTAKEEEKKDEEEEEEEEEDIISATRANSTSRSEAKGAGARLRAPCPYGRSCYRKNPAHFQECSHPDDPDYEEEEEEEEEEDDDRPECPYGTDCYRKNPLHRKECKHTKKPGRATRNAPKKTVGEDDEDDDSFIDDDSEDAGDDSDYAPPVSDDSGEEAKAFVKRRKTHRSTAMASSALVDT
ncbi:aprataxin and PNK-like factor isoform X1 [Cyclopterus lumpus]|uniref:Aprataxin and PNKP like factor n=1 Tax=Cyclopterus lumpus TaxID=8103 RepID=A0A8C3G093_CYCLU|nr:aprataxin and PNK-like factor isoform X1 [Cyclopterus lumpus]